MVVIAHLFVLRIIYGPKTAKLSILDLKTNLFYPICHYETFLFLYQVGNYRILAVANGIYHTYVCFTYFMDPNSEIKQIGLEKYI